jgi:hypothetical protein
MIGGDSVTVEVLEHGVRLNNETLTFDEFALRVGHQRAIELMSQSLLPAPKPAVAPKATAAASGGVSRMNERMALVLASFGAAASDPAQRVLLRELHRVCVDLLLRPTCAHALAVHSRQRATLRHLTEFLPVCALATRVAEIESVMLAIRSARAHEPGAQDTLASLKSDRTDEENDMEDECEEQAQLFAAAASAATAVAATTTTTAEQSPLSASTCTSRRTRRLIRREQLTRDMSPDEYVKFADVLATAFTKRRDQFSQWLRNEPPALVLDTTLDMLSVFGTGDAARRSVADGMTDEQFACELKAARAACTVEYEPVAAASMLANDLVNCVCSLATDWVEDVVDQVVTQRGGVGVDASSGRLTQEISATEAYVAAWRVWTAWQNAMVPTKVAAEADAAATAVATTKRRKRA